MSDSDRAGTHVVRGVLILPPEAERELSGTVHAMVEDVSRADAPAEVVGRQRLPDVSLRPGGTVPFAIEVPAGLIDERHTYAVRVHVDVSGSGEIRRGDFVSTQSHPVLTRGRGSEVDVPVKRV